MNEIVKQHGRFLLIRSEEGFAWTMPGLEGEAWYWHPGESQWTKCPCASPSPEQASESLDLDAPLATGAFRHHQPQQASNPAAGAKPPR